MLKNVLLCAAIGLFFNFSLSAQTVLPDDPLRDWRVLETEHFEIIYDKTQKKLAEDFAAEAERAHRFLEPLLKTHVPRKVPIAIADITDSSNGAATGIPRSEIEVYPVLPAATDPTGEYYKWTRELVTHEYTHILNFEPTSGFMGILRFLFGSLIKPGGYMPRWYTEGLAVEMESRLTPVGRGRSHFYSALPRSWVEGHTLGTETIDRIDSTEIPTWPRGQRPYTFGYFLMHELSELPNRTHSHDNIYGILDNRYGGRIPWFINGPVEDYFGLDYAGLLAVTNNVLDMRARNQLSLLKTTEKGDKLTQTGYFSFGSQISPDRLKLAAIVSDFDENQTIRLWQRQTPTQPFTLQKTQPEKITDGKNIQQISWRADSQHLVFDHSALWNHYNTYNELFDLDIKTKKAEQLTFGRRAREATVLPDGSLVYVAATPTKTELYLSDAHAGSPHLIFSPEDGERISSPRNYNDGVIYSHRDKKGKEWIEYLSLKTPDAHPTKLTQANVPGDVSVFPMSDQKSRTGFYYVSSETGVMNVYHIGDDFHKTPITNVSTYVTSPEIDTTANQVIYSRLTSEGFELESQNLTTPVSEPQKIPALINYPPADETDAPAAKIETEHDYNGLSYLFPQYMIPFIYLVPNGAIFDVSTSNNDPLRHHIYGLEIGYDTRASQPLEQLLYTNASFPFYIDANFANDFIYLAGANVTEQYLYGEVDTRHYLFSDSNKWLIGPEFTYRMTSFPPAQLLATEIGPGATLYYTNVPTPKDYQISPEWGSYFQIGYDYFLPSISNTSYQNINGMAGFYLSGSPMPRHHVISFKLSTSISPETSTIYTAARQAGGEFLGSLFSPSYLVRGYPVGEFIGWTLFTGNFEYRFPLSYQYSGQDTMPFFFSKWYGALVCDAATLDGGFWDSRTNPTQLTATKPGSYFMGSGAEARADMTLFYGFPLTVRLGLYYGFSSKAYGALTYFVGFGSVE